MADCKPVPAPFPSKTDKLIDELALPITDVDPVMHKQYQALIGSFLYLQSQTMTELSWSVSLLSRYMSKPGPCHMTAAKHILRYLKSRRGIHLRWCAQDARSPHTPGMVNGYADASFADVKPSRLSTTGYVFLVNNGAVPWRSSKTSENA